MVYKGFSMAKIIVALMFVALMLGVSTESMALERKLAGLALGDKAQSALKVYGNPDRITIGEGAAPAAGQSGPMLPGISVPGGTGPMPLDLSPFAGMGGGSLPGLPSVGGMPGMMSPPGGMPSSGPSAPASNDSKNAGSEDVRWTYFLSKGPTVEVIVSDNVIAQITISGQKWAGAKTANGVSLGDSYKKVLMTYGYPDKHEYVGRYLRVGYLQKSNIMFTLRDSKTVVGITIGLKD